jgi:hypothetical protein
MNSPYQNARAPTEISNFPDKLLVRLIILIYYKTTPRAWFFFNSHRLPPFNCLTESTNNLLFLKLFAVKKISHKVERGVFFATDYHRLNGF